MTTYDTIIACGMVIDGTRAQRLRADVGIKDGKIAKIGRLRASGYHYVLVNGEVTIQEDKETGTSPGRLLRKQ